MAWIDLEVLAGNLPARGLYRKAGFVQTGEIADMFRIDGESLGYVFMSLQLGPEADRMAV
jgi:ribosomal protein S18 acetylase RimI-like enzyme